MTIPFLLDFTPHKTAGEKCQSINEMVSINIEQRALVSTIYYEIGSLEDIDLPVTVKNLTNNTTLEINMYVDTNIFKVDDENVQFTLEPEQTRVTNISLNKENLNQTIRNLQGSIKLTVKNIKNGTIATRNTPVSLLTPVLLEEIVPTVIK